MSLLFLYLAKEELYLFCFRDSEYAPSFFFKNIFILTEVTVFFFLLFSDCKKRIGKFVLDCSVSGKNQ
jgi:hypothetical protein